MSPIEFFNTVALVESVMNEILKYLVAPVLSGAVLVAMFKYIITKLKLKNDEKKISDFLKGDKQYTFRSVHAIASNVNLSEARVREVCGNSKIFKRNELEKESWKLVESPN